MSSYVLNFTPNELKFCREVIRFFQHYEKEALAVIAHNEQAYQTLSGEHKKLLKRYKRDLGKLKKCIEVNYKFILLVLKKVNFIFGIRLVYPFQPDIEIDLDDFEKRELIFKQLVRDWSKTGEAERNKCFNPIIDEISSNYPAKNCNRSDISILVPGSGLGRLVFEIASRGFMCQGSENIFSLVMVSFFIMNFCKKVEEHEICPWVHQSFNNVRTTDQLMRVRFPDVVPHEILDRLVIMTTGSFVNAYKESNQWDCVATCFSIDSGQNIVQFIETVYKILKQGGIWVNLGPLLYRYFEEPSETTIGPSFEVIIEVIKKIGFEIEKERKGVKIQFGQNPNSMLKHEYESIFFVCRKPYISAEDFSDSSEERSNSNVGGTDSNGDISDPLENLHNLTLSENLSDTLRNSSESADEFFDADSNP